MCDERSHGSKIVPGSWADTMATQLLDDHASAGISCGTRMRRWPRAARRTEQLAEMVGGRAGPYCSACQPPLRSQATLARS